MGAPQVPDLWRGDEMVMIGENAAPAALVGRCRQRRRRRGMFADSPPPPPPPVSLVVMVVVVLLLLVKTCPGGR